jgi:hypothetical protein
VLEGNELMSEHEVNVRGEMVHDDGLAIDLGPVGGTTGHTAWHEMPLPQCPDCDGDLVTYEAGYAPSTRRCMGLASEGAYVLNGGCGSFFRVDCRDGRVLLERERFYSW